MGWMFSVGLADLAHSRRLACRANCDKKCTKDHHGKEGHGVREGGHACT